MISNLSIFLLIWKMTDPTQYTGVISVTASASKAADKGSIATISQTIDTPLYIPNSEMSISGSLTVGNDVVITKSNNKLVFKWTPIIPDTPLLQIPQVNAPSTVLSANGPYQFNYPAQLPEQLATQNPQIMLPTPSYSGMGNNWQSSISNQAFNDAETIGWLASSSPNNGDFNCSATWRNANFYNMIAMLPEANSYTATTTEVAGSGLTIMDWEILGDEPDSFLPWYTSDTGDALLAPMTNWTFGANTGSPAQTLFVDTANNFLDVKKTNYLLDNYISSQGTEGFKYIYGQGWYSQSPYSLQVFLNNSVTPAPPPSNPIYCQYTHVPNALSYPWFPISLFGTFKNQAVNWVSDPTHDSANLANVNLIMEERDIMHMRANINHDIDHQQTFVRSWCGIYDQTAHPVSSPTNPIIFPMNNSEESAFNPSMTTYGKEFIPKIWQCFLPFYANDGSLTRPGWPAPCHQALYSAPNAYITTVADLNQTSIGNSVLSNGNFTGFLESWNEPSDYNPNPIPYDTTNNTDYSDNGTFIGFPQNMIFGAEGDMMKFGTYSFPKNFSALPLTAELFFNFVDDQQGGIGATNLPWRADYNATTAIPGPGIEFNSTPSVRASTGLTLFPAGYATDPRWVFSGRYCFMFEEEHPDTAPGVYDKLVVFEKTIIIPPGSYSPLHLVNQLNLQLNALDGDGNSAITHTIDLREKSYLFVASDSDNTPIWRKGATMDGINNYPNRVGKATAGHVGRMVHALAGPNAIIQVGSPAFNFGLDDNGLIYFNSTLTPDNPKGLVSASFAPGVPSSY